MSSNYPLVSCICITSNRPKMLESAINCFISQDYPNKELVISAPLGDLATKELLKKYSTDPVNDVLFIERDPEESLGNARNEAIYQCNGVYVCIWDDDDWHDQKRLSAQYESLQSSTQRLQASVLMRIILYDCSTHLAYLSFSYHWDGTLFCRKEMVLQNQYANRDKAEDTHLIPFLEGKRLLSHIDESPFLYIYIYHGHNTWPYSHFEHFLEKSHLLTEEYTAKVRAILKD